MSDVLPALIGKRIWTDKTAWTGLVKCCELEVLLAKRDGNIPQSFNVLSQIPAGPFEDTMSSSVSVCLNVLPIQREE